MHPAKRALAIVLIALCLFLSIQETMGAPDFNMVLTPSINGVTAGQVASYNIALTSQEGFTGTIALSVSGLPANTSSDFSPSNQVNISPGQTLQAVLTISTSPSTPLGWHPLNVTATCNSVTHWKPALLMILGPALYASVSTDKQIYALSETVKVSGSVVDLSGNPVPEAFVLIQIMAPSRTILQTTFSMTDTQGNYRCDLTPVSVAGTYAIYVTAKKTGYLDGYSHATFTVSETSKPSITISTVAVSDVNGTVKTEFKRGETVIVWVTVQNSGGDLVNGLIWIEVDDPNSVPVTLMFQYATIKQDGTVTVGFSAGVFTSLPLGQYRARAFTSDKLISQGGRFLAAKETTFTLTP